MTKIAINGFGRIGRQAFKIALNKNGVEIVGINDLGPIESLANLLRYDSVYGVYEKEIKIGINDEIFSINEIINKKDNGEDFTDANEFLIIDNQKIPFFSIPKPEELPWGELNVDVVIESTGIFIKNRDSEGHLKAGAKHVVLSAPSKGENKADTFLIGVNSKKFAGQDIVSNASCTTNCVGPVTAVMLSKFGIEKAGLTTIHSYTSTQNLVDAYTRGTHGKLRRQRAAAQNIVPTSTGAAIATTRVLPELEGKFDGLAIRVPTITGSLSDFTFLISKKTNVEEVQNTFIEMSENFQFKGVLGVTWDPVVSTDIIGRTESAIVDLSTIQVIDGDLVKVLAWYDNEMGYSNRLVELACELALGN